MGVLRLSLALAVVAGHSWQTLGSALVNPALAVSIFYVISGFYMALVLDRAYPATPRGTLLFWSNRLLRLLPSYWTVVVLCGVVVAVLVVPGDRALIETVQSNILWASPDRLSKLQPGTVGLIAFANVGIFVQDVLLFARVAADGTLAFVPTLVTGDQAAYRYVAIPQAWSLAVELEFYLVAPFLLRQRAWVIALVLLASLALRVLLARAGLADDPWTYRFFPTALAFFLAGSLCYRWLDTAHRVHRNVKIGGLIVAAGLVVLNGYLGEGLDRLMPARGYVVSGACALIAVIVALAPVFTLTARSRFDSLLGDLSYPLYIVHILVLQICLMLASVYPARMGWFATPGNPYLVALSLLMALVLTQVVDRPISFVRSRRKRTVR